MIQFDEHIFQMGWFNHHPRQGVELILISNWFFSIPNQLHWERSKKTNTIALSDKSMASSSSTTSMCFCAARTEITVLRNIKVQGNIYIYFLSNMIPNAVAAHVYLELQQIYIFAQVQSIQFCQICSWCSHPFQVDLWLVNHPPTKCTPPEIRSY